LSGRVERSFRGATACDQGAGGEGPAERIVVSRTAQIRQVARMLAR
jgi:hypothetical protein